MKKLTLILPALVLVCSPFAAATDPISGDPCQHVAIPDPSDELMQVDAEWGRDALSIDMEDLLSMWTDDARMILPGIGVLQGKQAIKEYVIGNRADPNFKVSWTPEGAEVATSGEMGYTYGMRSVTRTGDDGQLVNMSAPYLTVWQKHGGAWKCAIGK